MPPGSPSTAAPALTAATPAEVLVWQLAALRDG